MTLPEGRKPLDDGWYARQLETHTTIISSMQRHRHFMKNTCPASRHAQTIAESLLNHGEYSMLQEDPAHCANTIASVVSSLYQARSFLKSLGYDWRVLEDGNVEWYPVENSNEEWYPGRASRSNMSSPGDKDYED